MLLVRTKIQKDKKKNKKIKEIGKRDDCTRVCCPLAHVTRRTHTNTTEQNDEKRLSIFRDT